MILSILRAYSTGINSLVAFIGNSISILMPLIALVVAFEVFSRYLLDSPTIWAYDLSLFLSSYLAALGGAFAQQKQAHINVDILYISVSANTKRLFNLLAGSLAIFFMLVIIYVSFGKFNEAVNLNYRRMSEWAPPMHHFWVMLMVAASLIILQFSNDMMKDIYHLITGKDLLPNQNKEEEDGN